MTGLLGNSEFWFPRISIKHWDSPEKNSLFPSGPVIRRLLLHTVAVESPESSVATFKPFERVVTLVSGTLYNDCNNRKKSEILNGKKK